MQGAKVDVGVARLDAVRAFVNTHGRAGHPDLLDDPVLARAWLDGALRADVDADPATLARLRDLREALRLTLLAHNGLADPEAAAAALTPICEGSTLALTVGLGAVPEVTGAGEGVEGFVNDVLAAVAIASIDGSWRREKACADPGCRAGFRDATKNGSARFCSSGGCGNRSRQRAYRARHRDDDGKLA